MLNALAIFKQSRRLSAVNLLGYALALVVGIMTARALGPENMGVLALIGTWAFYVQLVKCGLLDGAGREMAHRLGQGRGEEARRIQNIAMTGEFASLALLAGLLVIIGWCYHTPVVRIGLWLAAISVVLNGVRVIWTTPLTIHQRFDIIARVNLLLAVVTPLGVLLTLRKLGIYSPLVMPVVTGLLAVLLLSRSRRLVAYRRVWEWATARRLMSEGFPLALLTMVMWAYFMSDRPAILAAGLSLTMVGYYTFAANFVRGLAQLFWDFTSVLQPSLWRSFGAHGSVRAVSHEVTRLWLVYTFVSCAMATAAQAGFGALVHWVAPRFIPSIRIFEVLVFLLVAQNSIQLPTLLLNSKVLNRQHVSLWLWGAALVINTAALYGLARAGMSLVGIAAASMGIDAVLAVIAYGTVHGELIASPRMAKTFYSRLIGLVVISVGLYGLFQWGPFAYDEAHAVWPPLLLRSVTACVVWGGLAVAIAHRWRTLSEPVQEILLAPIAGGVS